MSMLAKDRWDNEVADCIVLVCGDFTTVEGVTRTNQTQANGRMNDPFFPRWHQHLGTNIDRPALEQENRTGRPLIEQVLRRQIDSTRQRMRVGSSAT